RRGEYRSALERLLFDVVRPGRCPHRVLVDGREVPQQLHRGRFDAAEAGWHYDIGLGSVLIKTPDHGGDLTTDISYEPVDRNRLIRGVSGIVAVVLVAALGACAPASGARTSAEATPENPLVLTLANNLGDDHVTSQALAEFASDVKRRSGGRIEVKIYGNGQL